MSRGKVTTIRLEAAVSFNITTLSLMFLEHSRDYLNQYLNNTY